LSKLSKRLPADNEKLQPLVGEISWSKNQILMAGGKDNLKREFYHAYRDLPKVQPPVAQIGWSHNQIIVQRAQGKLAVKDEYTFDFIEMGEDLNAEAATINKNLEEMRV
jgi:hypothetical protein